MAGPTFEPEIQSPTPQLSVGCKIDNGQDGRFLNTRSVFSETMGTNKVTVRKSCYFPECFYSAILSWILSLLHIILLVVTASKHA